MKLKMRDLEFCFEEASKHGALYVAVVIKMKGFDSLEVIINPHSNIVEKLKYYMKVYDENLNHIHSDGIRIVGCTYGNSFDEISENLHY